jgi:hypothetical protein
MRSANPIVLLALTACGSSHPATSPPGSALDVAGHWVSDCTTTPDSKGYFTMDFHNTTDHWQLAYVVFGDAKCATPLVAVDITGPYTIGGASPTVSGAHEAVFEFDKKSITPKAQPLADALNGMPECGGGFAVGSAHDVYERGCPGFGQYPHSACAADYDVIWREGDQLRFGQRPADNNMCSADRRPAALSPLILRRR